MKLFLATLSAVFFLSFPAQSQEIAPLQSNLEALKPENILPASAQKDYIFVDKVSGNKPATFGITAGGNFPLFTAEVLATSQAHYNVQSKWKSPMAIKKGDVLLARLAMRAIYARQESGEGVVNFYVQKANSSGDKSVMIQLGAGPEWKVYDIPFIALEDMNASEAEICISYATMAQKVEITGLQVLNFGKQIKLKNLPTTKFTYAGREEKAEWRDAALKRIDEIRTAPLVIRVTDAKGKPVKGAKVSARLVNPEFKFGTAVTAKYLCEDTEDAKIYQRNLLELFNTGTIDNGLKWGAWLDPKKRECTKAAVAWINNKGLHLRGHNLVWPGKKFTPYNFHKKPGFVPGLSDSITAHIDDIATFTKGKVYGWDVINEMMHEKDYFEVMPRTQAAEWFKQARRIDPKAELFINEYSMLNSVVSPRNIATYLELIKELQSYGAPIDAIGVQGHVGRQPRNPAQVISDLDLLAAAKLPLQITEFDINSPDEELQADYTRDFLIACYSHPVVTGFIMWGFWERAHWKPDAAMYRKDWTPKPNLAAWRDLVTNQWRTKVNAQTSSNGSVTSKGHLGRYEITVTSGNKTRKIVYDLSKKSAPLKVKI